MVAAGEDPTPPADEVVRPDFVRPDCVRPDSGQVHNQSQVHSRELSAITGALEVIIMASSMALQNPAEAAKQLFTIHALAKNCQILFQIKWLQATQKVPIEVRKEVDEACSVVTSSSTSLPPSASRRLRRKKAKEKLLSPLSPK